MIRHELRKLWFLVTVAAAMVCAAIVTLPKFVEPKYMKTLRAEGFPTTREELNTFYPPVPDEENAALLYRKAYALLPELTETEKQYLPYLGDFELGEPGAPLPRETLDAMAGYVERSREAFDVLKQAAQMPKCRFLDDIVFPRWDREEYPNLHGLSGFVGLRMLCASVKDDFQELEDTSRLFIALLRAIGHDPLVLTHLVTIGCCGIYSGALEDALNSSAPPEESLVDMAAELEDYRAQRPAVFRRQLMGETCYCLVHSREPVFSDFENWFRVDGTEEYAAIKDLGIPPILTTAIDAVASPFMGEMVMARAFRAVTQESETANPKDAEGFAALLDESAPVRFGLLPFTLDIAAYAASSERLHRSQLSLVLAAVAVERYHRREGVLPANLGVLVPDFLVEIPMDLVAGEPIRYVVTDNGYELSAVWRISDDWLPPTERDRRMTFTVSRPDLRGKAPGK